MYVETLLLFSSFALIHSITAARCFKCVFLSTLKLPYKTYRFSYNILSFVSFLPFSLYWFIHRAESPIIVKFEGILFVLVIILKITGVVIFGIAFIQSGVKEFFGLKFTKGKLIDRGLYGIVRHPQYLGGIIFIWASPVITFHDFESYILLTLYLIVGAFLEEKKLEEELRGYKEYKKRVPFLIPLPHKGR